jgi:hypothetical protein
MKRGRRMNKEKEIHQKSKTEVEEEDIEGRRKEKE